VGPCIGGALVFFPFIWVLGYPDTYEFELYKSGNMEKRVPPEDQQKVPDIEKQNKN